MNEGKVTNRKVGEEETGTRLTEGLKGRRAVGWIEDSSFFFFLLSTPTKGWKKKKDNPQRPSFVEDESKKKQERWRWWVEDESKKKKRPNDRHAIPELISVRMHIVQPSVGRTFPLLLLWSSTISRRHESFPTKGRIYDLEWRILVWQATIGTKCRWRRRAHLFIQVQVSIFEEVNCKRNLDPVGRRPMKRWVRLPTTAYHWRFIR